MAYTSEHIIALAPTPNTAKKGKELANPQKWVELGKNERALWGDCKGSGKKPYSVQIDLQGPAFRCSCPSRQFPCKHALGLMLLHAHSPKQIPQAIPSDELQAWLEKRNPQAQTQTAPPLPQQILSPEAQQKLAQKQKRKERNARLIQRGIYELEDWLRDVMRQGLAAAQSQPYQYWERAASRMKDAKMSLARAEILIIPLLMQQEEWVEDVLDVIGGLYLMVNAFKNREKLPKKMLAELGNAMGVLMRKEEVLAKVGHQDQWVVMGQIEENSQIDTGIKIRRSWLFGVRTRQAALILDFSFGRLPATFLKTGRSFQGELVRYPANYPLRALIKQYQVQADEQASPLPPAENRIQEALEQYALALSHNPWLSEFPMILSQVIPVDFEGKYYVMDAEQAALPLRIETQQFWQLMAISGGKGIYLFGEWNGRSLLPLSIVEGVRWIRL